MKDEQNRPVFGSFNHVAVEVKDLHSALHFYMDILGLSELPMPKGVKENGISWLDMGNDLALHIVQKEDAAPGKTAHIAIRIDDVNQWQKYLISRNIDIYQPQVEIYAAERIFIKDPSGNRLELVKWREETE